MERYAITDGDLDYAGAAIRLATSMHAKVQRLVFGWVELYPHEIPLPPLTHAYDHFGNVTLRHSVTPVTLDQALNWYAEVARGTPTVPLMPKLKLAPVVLSAEPGWGRWTVGADVPFEPPWHGGARLHRLVNMADAAQSNGFLAEPDIGSPHWDAARLWIADRLHFDVFASDAWIGGCALLAPNPISRSLRHQMIGRTPDGAESIRVTADLRAGITPTAVSVRVNEKRADGIVVDTTRRLDQFGSAEVHFPQPIDALGYDLHEDRLGLLVHKSPYPLLRQASVNLALRTGKVVVEVPSPKQNGRVTDYERDVDQPVGTTIVGDNAGLDGSIRLALLQHRMNSRTGSARPGGGSGAADAFVFYADRKWAAEAIRSLLASTRKTVVIVDPFFDVVALRDFALSIPVRDADIRVLTEYRAERRDIDGGEVPMENLATELASAAELLTERGLGRLDVRVSRGDTRRYHDRFLIIDDDVWHCGHSFNQVGRNVVSVMTRLRRPDDMAAMIKADFDGAELFDAAHRRWLDRDPPRPSALRAMAIKLIGGLLARLEGKQ